MLKALGISIIPASAPDFFTEDTPTAVLVLQNWQRLESASVSVSDDAREGRPSVQSECLSSLRILRANGSHLTPAGWLKILDWVGFLLHRSPTCVSTAD